MTNIVICGAEKEKVRFAAGLLSISAAESGERVRMTEPEEEGASSGLSCHIKTGGSFFYPYVLPGQADMILAFEPGEAVRSLKYLKKDGCVVLIPEASIPEKNNGYSPKECLQFLKRRVKNLSVVSAGSIERTCGMKKAAWIALIGAASRTGRLGVDRETIEKVIRSYSPPGKEAVYRTAFILGWAMGS
jgi:indolepyruvate ferredoxin oxidoreductase beta subunit